MSGGKTINTDAVRLGGLAIQSTGYGVAIPIAYGTNRIPPVLIEYTNFVATAHVTSQSSGGKGGGVTQNSTTYTYTAAVCMGLCEGPVAGFGLLWINKSTYAAPASRGLSIFAGTYPQTPWVYMTTYFPARAVGYQGIAYVACANYDLGSSASLGNHTFEVVGRGTLQNGYDVNAIDVITDFLSNVNYGVNFPYIGATTQAWNYCQANGIFISPLLNTQQPAATWLTGFSKIANAGLVWSAGLLKIIPYGDTAVAGHGATYTPNNTPVYSLTDDDFQSDGSDPVIVNRVKQADAFNAVRIEYLNRSNQYNVEPADVTDQANAEAYGYRLMSPITMHEICIPSIAKLVAQTILQRALYVRNTYTFKLTWKYCLLEPMDIVEITDSVLGLAAVPVRIQSIEESYDGLLAVVAEEMPLGVSQPVQYPQQNTSAYQPNFNIPAVSANTPVIFAPPIEIATSTLEMWVGACGPAGYGGCFVWVSSDGSTYKQVGSMTGNSRMGTNSGLPLNADPDTVHTLAVDLTSSLGQLLSGTQADADLFHTLCYVDGEFLSYETTMLTSSYQYGLTYLRRGAYNSKITAHSAGTPFVRLDDAIFKIPYTADQIGKTMYVKLQAMNPFQAGVQDLASCTAYTVVIPAPPLPADVTNFAAQQQGNVVVFSWNSVHDYALKGYDIGYAAQGETNWNNFILLTESAKGTEMTNAAVPIGTWVFGIRAKDVIDQLSANAAYFNLIVTTTSPIVAQVQQDPTWYGALSSMVLHYTGVLIPAGTKMCNQYSAFEEFNQFVPDPVATCNYTTPIIDTGYDSVLRIYSTSSAVMGYGQTGTINKNLSLDTWLSVGTDLGIYAPWMIGQVNMRYMKERIALNGIVAGAVPILTAMTAWADTTPVIENVASVVISAGGTTITFPQPYHQTPNVICNALGTTALVANASNITATGCTIHVFNSSGTDVGGNVTYSATGA